MNAIEQAHQVYGFAQHHIRTPRAIEVQLISDITSRLNREDQPFHDLVAAIDDNRRLWRTLAIDVADNENTLPQELRARIFYLAEFTDHQTRKVIREKVSATPLLEINMAILLGLKQQGASV